MAKDKKNKAVIDPPQGILNPPGYSFFKRWMSLPEAAFYTSQGEATIKKAIYRGELPVIQRGPRSKIILDVTDLDTWMSADKGVHKGPVDERQRAKNGRFKQG